MKRVFNEAKTEELTAWDSLEGYIRPDKLFITHHEAVEAVEEQGHYETVAEYPNGGKDVEWVVDVPGVEAKDAWDEYEDIYVFVPYTAEEKNQRLRLKYIPSPAASAAAYVRAMMKTSPLTDDESKLIVSGVCEDWAPGNYAVGDIRNHMGQTWECHQAHDNTVYPDIMPDNPQTWATFWRPLHGKTKETARPWVKPWAGTTDMYHAGEFMVYTDGKIYKCIADTVYSPEEYAQSWEVDV